MKLKIFSLLIAVLMSTAVLTGCNKASAGAESSSGSGGDLSTAQGGEPSASESAVENTLLTDEEAAKIIKTRYQELIDVCSMTSWYESPEDIQTDVIVQERDGGYFCLVDDTFLNHNKTLSKLLGNDISYEGARKTLLSLFSSFSFYTSQELLNCFTEIDGRLWFEACNPENPHPQFINNYFSAELLEINSVTEDKISFSLGHELLAKEGKDVRVPLELVKNSNGEWVFNETLLNISAYAGPYWTGIGETLNK